MKGTLDLTPRSCTWEPETHTPAVRLGRLGRLVPPGEGR